MTEKHQHSSRHTSSRHQHRRHHIDDAERFKQRQLRASHRKKIFSKILFWALSALALAIIYTVFWLYTHE